MLRLGHIFQMRDFVERIVIWFLLRGVDFPLVALIIGKTIFPGLLESNLTFLLWPKSEFVLKNIVQSTKQTYSDLTLEKRIVG